MCLVSSCLSLYSPPSLPNPSYPSTFSCLYCNNSLPIPSPKKNNSFFGMNHCAIQKNSSGDPFVLSPICLKRQSVDKGKKVSQNEWLACGKPQYHNNNIIVVKWNQTTWFVSKNCFVHGKVKSMEKHQIPPSDPNHIICQERWCLLVLDNSSWWWTQQLWWWWWWWCHSSR